MVLADQGILLKNRGGNAIVNAKSGMPQNFLHLLEIPCFLMLDLYIERMVVVELYYQVIMMLLSKSL